MQCGVQIDHVFNFFLYGHKLCTVCGMVLLAGIVCSLWTVWLPLISIKFLDHVTCFKIQAKFDFGSYGTSQCREVNFVYRLTLYWVFGFGDLSLVYSDSF